MSSYHPRLNINALVFACNDVLIDMTYSYQDVVSQTVQIYLERALGLSPSKEALLTPAEVQLLQQVGYFSSYSDLAKALAMYFVELLPPVPVPTFPSRFHVPALMAYLQFAGGNLQVSIDELREHKDIEQLAEDVAAAGGGLDGAHKTLPRENRHMLVSSGKITETNILGRIFQELYLGADMFEKVHGVPAIIIQSSGYAEHESLLVKPEVLAQISQKVTLAVVSDRPRGEVERSLKARKIHPYFKVLVTGDEIAAAKANPVPEPWALLEAARSIQPTPTHSAYVGSTPADIQAARAANKVAPFSAIGCLVNAHDKTAMRDAFETHKADMILGHPNNLKELILG